MRGWKDATPSVTNPHIRCREFRPSLSRGASSRPYRTRRRARDLSRQAHGRTVEGSLRLFLRLRSPLPFRHSHHLFGHVGVSSQTRSLITKITPFPAPATLTPPRLAQGPESAQVGRQLLTKGYTLDKQMRQTGLIFFRERSETLTGHTHFPIVTSSPLHSPARLWWALLFCMDGRSRAGRIGRSGQQVAVHGRAYLTQLDVNARRLVGTVRAGMDLPGPPLLWVVPGSLGPPQGVTINTCQCDARCRGRSGSGQADAAETLRFGQELTFSFPDVRVEFSGSWPVESDDDL